MRPNFSDAVPLDHAMFQETSELLGGKLATLLAYYIEDAHASAQGLSHSVAHAAWQEAGDIAHTLKSSSLQFGFVGVGDAARELEMHCIARVRGNEAPGDARNITKSICDAIESLSPHVLEYIEKLSG